MNRKLSFSLNNFKGALLNKLYLVAKKKEKKNCLILFALGITFTYTKFSEPGSIFYSLEQLILL
jgi:hypothetical protein